MHKYFLYTLASIIPLPLLTQTAGDSPVLNRMNDIPPIITECDGLAADCTTRHLQAFIDERLYYPWKDREKKIKGRSVVQFTIDHQGQMKDINCLDAPTPAMARKAEYLTRRIRRHFDWKPGLREGQAVDALYYLPITFDPDRHPLGPPPPPPPPPAPEEEEIFKVVAEMPRFPGCEDLPKAERKACANRKLRDFIHEHLVHPEQAKKAQYSAEVVVQFIIERNGSVSSVKALNDPGYGLAEAAVKAVNLMQQKGIKWRLGSSRYRAVRVQYELPIQFNYKQQKDGSISPE
jgi:TonB family protein